MPQIMKGRIVASLDEVKAAQIDLDGSFTYFHCPAENCIYAKAIDINGMPVIQTYKLSNDQAAAPKRYADAETVEALQQKVTSLERYLKGEVPNANESVHNEQIFNQLRSNQTQWKQCRKCWGTIPVWALQWKWPKAKALMN